MTRPDVLEMALEGLEKAAQLFAPLQSAVIELRSCFDIVKSTRNQSDCDSLAEELQNTLGLVRQYGEELGLEGTRSNIENIISSIKTEAARIKEIQSRGTARQAFGSEEVREHVMKGYRTIEESYRRLQLDANIWASRKLDKQRQSDLLQSMSPEEDARYNSSYSDAIDRHECTANTREGIIEGLHSWAENPKAPAVCWMNGMAGTGKTTIAYSFCQWLEERNMLGANFFCSRAKESCYQVNRIVPTIACQLGRYSPAFGSALCRVLEIDRGITELNLVSQFEKLINNPLLESKAGVPDSVVIVIDALDECKDRGGVQRILATLMRFARNLPVKFFVSSRPEPGICENMQRSPDYSPEILRLHDIEESVVMDDITTYFQRALGFMSTPPTEEQINQLAGRAGRLFIYAATVIRYIRPGIDNADSSRRLSKILEATSQPIHRNNHLASLPIYTELDKLYSTILAGVYDDRLEEEEKGAIRQVLWTVVCVKEPLTAEALGVLLNRTKGDVILALKPLQSVLHISQSDQLVSTFHASFPDYILDGSRSREFSCHQAEHSYLLADRSFEVMKLQLHFNICNLESSSIFDSDIQDLGIRTRRFISAALVYACSYWGDHLQLSRFCGLLGNKLIEFLQDRLLFWMEVLNLSSRQRTAKGAVSLRHALRWFTGSEELDGGEKLIADARDFLTRYAASACTRSTPHIYLSALALCPKESLVYLNYWGRLKGLLDVKGKAMKLQANTAIATWVTDSTIISLAFHPDGTCIASGSLNGVIQVWDLQTGTTVAGPFKAHNGSVQAIAFSSDGLQIGSGSKAGGMIGCSSPVGELIIWDPWTGGIVSGPVNAHKGSVESIAFSTNGNQIVTSSDDGTVAVWNVPLGVTPTRTRTKKSSVYSVQFLQDNSHIAITCRDGTTQLWDIGAHARNTAGAETGMATPAADFQSAAFSSDGALVVLGSSSGNVLVRNVHTSEIVSGPFEAHANKVTTVAFSPSGERVASGSIDCTIRVWDALTGDIVAGPFNQHTSQVNAIAFSPDGTQIVSGSGIISPRLEAGTDAGDQSIRVWDLQTSSAVGGPDSFDGKCSPVTSIAFSESPDSAYIVSKFLGHDFRAHDAYTGDFVQVDDSFPIDKGLLNSVEIADNSVFIVSGREFSKSAVQWATPPDQAGLGGLRIATISHDGAWIAFGQSDGNVLLRDTLTGDALLTPLKGHKGWVSALAFSFDDARIASGSSDCTIRVWNSATGCCVSEPFRRHTSHITSLSFSQDGQRIVSGDDTCNVLVWDVQTRDIIGGPFRGHPNPAISVVFSHSGNKVATASSGRLFSALRFNHDVIRHNIRVWDILDYQAATERLSLKLAASSTRSVHVIPDPRTSPFMKFRS